MAKEKRKRQPQTEKELLEYETKLLTYEVLVIKTVEHSKKVKVRARGLNNAALKAMQAAETAKGWKKEPGGSFHTTLIEVI